MPRFSFAATVVAAIAITADATSVSVIEIGNGGTVHRTTATAPQTTASGVLSFFRSLHEDGNGSKSRHTRTTQYPGMNVVPNIFSRPDGGISIGITGNINLAAMPTLASILDDEGAVGHFNMKSSEGQMLTKKLGAELIDHNSLETSIMNKAKAAVAEDGNRLESVGINIGSDESAAEVDASLSSSLKAITNHSKQNSATFIVHIFVEENEEVFNTRLMNRRRLEDANDDGEGDDAAAADDAAEGDDAAAEEEEEDADMYYAGQSYGNQFMYQKANGVYYNPYRSMNEIQSYNVLLWTAIGLFTILFTAFYKMLNMRLLPDTLLFGESAKVVAE